MDRVMVINAIFNNISVIIIVVVGFILEGWRSLFVYRCVHVYRKIACSKDFD